ncbi:MAG: hypothetical protein MMC23_008961 [Stictis urceolatum]|nr:hypothetical protein [Stictis urceolata]
MAELIQDEYVAGLRRGNLAEDLLWYVQDCIQSNNEPSRRPEKYRAPSFAWTSVDRSIVDSVWGPRPDKLLLSVDDVVIESAGSDTTGAVKGGYIQTTACFKQFTLRSISLEGQKCWLLQNGKEDLMQSGEYPTRLVSLDVDRIDCDNCNAQGSLFYIPARVSSSQDTEELIDTYLLLEHIREAEYSRIGIAIVQYVSYNNAMMAARRDESLVSCLSYKAERHLYTFRIN